MTINISETEILLNFLKSGLSTRKLDKLFGYNNTKGWVSWSILKKYNLKDNDKGKLFIYTENQVKDCINSLNSINLDDWLGRNPPKIVEKYKNSFVIAESEYKFYKIFSGETRNIVRDFFISKKRLTGKCQYKNCAYNGQLDTVHLLIDRPSIFLNSARKHKTEYNGGLFKFNVYDTMKDFLQGHSKNKSVCFLCKRHHNLLHNAEKAGKLKLNLFKRDILM